MAGGRAGGPLPASTPVTRPVAAPARLLARAPAAPCVPGGATRRAAPRCRPQVVLRKLALALMPKLDDELRHSTAEDAAFYEHRLQVRAGLPLMGGWPVPQACGPWAAEAPPSTEAQQAAAAIQ